MSASGQTAASGPFPAESASHAAADAARALREALRKADVEAAQGLRWLAPRPPGERDLLSDLAAAEGLTPAIQRLSRFWQRAEVRLERVRGITPCEAEVYERLQLPGESLPIVTLVRRDNESSRWRVVCTNEAYDERFVLWIAVTAEAVDDVRWTRAFVERHGPHGELVMDGADGVLGHPDHGWLVHVRGPFLPATWPEVLPGEGGRVIELATALSPDPADRRAQLDWMLKGARVFLEELDGQGAFVPAHDKLVLAQALAAAADGTLTASQELRFWARIEEGDGYLFTSGLRQLGLPEVEAPKELLGSPDATARLLRWLGGTLLESPTVPSFGTELVLDDESVLLVAGRRGPRRGRSYGRWGAMGLVRTDPAFDRGSRTRMRVPDAVTER
ncbi:MAG TPA: hypothetical protein RMH99_14530 [Sandaracinaceae bacterium LLY-WYZ-13_1]|nr:hypothetical protein [Sandaracinaceae bacterium LLY-WYZ-13_1]